MVSAALRPDWTCAVANDIDPKKCASYRKNWGGDTLVEGDIAALPGALLRQPIDLYWASSPCQDLSLAGQRRGFEGQRSGVFFRWIDHVAAAATRGFAPRMLAFENVTGLLTSRGGSDLLAVVRSFVETGYNVGAMEIDAAHFLPQSRPRLFVFGVRRTVPLPRRLLRDGPVGPFHSSRLASFARQLPDELRKHWVWWNLDPPEEPRPALESIIDPEASNCFSPDKVAGILEMMDPPSLARLKAAQATGKQHVGTIYRRGRPDAAGVIRQRAELRLDGLAGCLRTPAGGSSRQTLVLIRDGIVAMRLLSAREALRLMGINDNYILPDRYNEAYKLAGDGVAVPVVRHLRMGLFDPVVKLAEPREAA